MHVILRTVVLATGLLALGCSSGDVPIQWPELHPVSGMVKIGGKPANGGYIQFRAVDTAGADFLAGGEVGTDGTFKLTTLNVHDKSGTKKDGAPVGKHKVTYMPPGTEQSILPIELPNPVTVNAGANNVPVDLPAKK